VGQYRVDRTATRYRLDGPGIESGGARLSAPIQTDRGTHLDFCTMSIVSFTGVKRRGCDVNHSPPFSAEIKKKVEPYSSVCSRQVIGWILPLPLKTTTDSMFTPARP